MSNFYSVAFALEGFLYVAFSLGGWILYVAIHNPGFRLSAITNQIAIFQMAVHYIITFTNFSDLL